MSVAPVPAIDMNKLNPFIAPPVTDLGSAVHSGMVVMDEQLGPYQALAGGPMNSRQPATPAKTDERCRREWLASQAAGGHISYDAKAGKFSRREEQAFALATEAGPAYLSGALEPALGDDSFSTLLCTLCLRSQEVGLCLGAKAGETRIREGVTSAGFHRFRRARKTPFHIVYEARP
jgi:hypothetical protein